VDDQRLARLETRVDEIKDDVSEIKAEQKINSHSITDLKEYVREQWELVKMHVSGDEKIINEIAPIIEEFRFQQQAKKRRMDTLKSWTLKLGIVSTVVGIYVGLIKIFDL
jgi:hypothetical protein